MKAGWVGENVGWWLMRYARAYAKGHKHFAHIVYNCWLQYIFGAQCPYEMPPEVKQVADCLRRALLSQTRFWFDAAWRCLPPEVQKEAIEREIKWDLIHCDEPDV